MFNHSVVGNDPGEVIAGPQRSQESKPLLCSAASPADFDPKPELPMWGCFDKYLLVAGPLGIGFAAPPTLIRMGRYIPV